MLAQRIRRKNSSILRINHQSRNKSSLKNSLLFSLEVSSSLCPGGAGILICEFKHLDSSITQISSSMMNIDTAIFILDLFVNGQASVRIPKMPDDLSLCARVTFCIFLGNLCLSLMILQIRILSHYAELMQGNLESRNCH